MTSKTRTTREPRRTDAAPAPAGDGFFPTGWLIASYFVLPVLFFMPALMPGVTIFGTDYLAISYIFEAFVTERFAAGELPTWMPYVYGGVPFFANPMDIYYPVTLLLRLIGVETHRHLVLIFIVQFFLAGSGTYLLLRELGVRRPAAYIAGLLYLFSGYLISFIFAGHEGRAIVATLAPLFFFALHRAIRTGRPHWFVLGGGVLGSAFLSNQIQSAYYLLLGGGLWAAFALWTHGIFRAPRALAGRLAGGAAVLVLGFALAAINFVPFLGYVDASPRGGEGRGYEYATSWAMSPGEILGLAVPERTGFIDTYSGHNALKYHTEYAGALAILLGLAGVWLLRRNRYAWFFFGLGAFALTISLGDHTPLYRLYYELLPGTSRFRAPSISFYLVTLSLVVIAGLAYERLAGIRAALRSRVRTEKAAADAAFGGLVRIGLAAAALVAVWGVVVSVAAPTPPTVQPTTMEELRAAQAALNHPNYTAGVWRFALFLVLSGGGLWLWLRGTLSDRIATALLAVVAVADLWVVNRHFLDTVPEPAVYFAPDEVVDFLRSRPGGPFRTFVLFDLPQDNYLPHHGLEIVGGEHGNQLQSYNEFLGAGERTYTDFHNLLGDPRFLAMVNARYIVTGQRIGAEPVFEGRTRSGRTAFVYENTMALPRAYVVPAARRAELPDGAIAVMRGPEFDPWSEVVLYDPAPLPPAAADSLAWSARVVRHEPTEAVVEVSTEGAGYLVVTDNFYDGWTATVDGEPAPILRANHTFRAVALPPGDHVVAFRFEPRPVRIGLVISLIAFGIVAAFGGAAAFRAIRAPAAAA